jgi:Tol biopolymer transport system component
MKTRLATLTLLVLLLIGLLPASAQEVEIRLVLTSRYAEPPQLYTSQTDGSDIQPFEGNFEVGGSVVSFSQSPDHSKIAYISRKDRDGVYPTNELIVYDLESGKNTQLTNDGLEKGYVNWLPDSTTLVYLALGPEGRYDEIRSLNLTSGETQTLVTAQSIAEAIGLEMVIIRELWISPDGTKLVGWVKTGLPEVYSILVVMDADGTNIRQLTSNEDRVSSPTWGTTSDYVFFDHLSDINPTDPYHEIYRININANPLVPELVINLRDLTSDEELQAIKDLSVMPDGRIVWQLYSSQNLYVFDPATNQAERIPLHAPTEVELLGWIELPS